MHKTTFRQLKFIDAYLETGIGYESARVAGYSGKPKNLATRASKLLSQDNIQQLITNELAKRATKVEQKLDDHAQEVQKIKERIEFLAEHADAQAVQLKANETLAKIAGMLEDKVLVRKEGEQVYQRLILEKFDESGEQRLIAETPIKPEQNE